MLNENFCLNRREMRYLQRAFKGLEGLRKPLRPP